jgi:hypothetical protein
LGVFFFGNLWICGFEDLRICGFVFRRKVAALWVGSWQPRGISSTDDLSAFGVMRAVLCVVFKIHIFRPLMTSLFCRLSLFLFRDERERRGGNGHVQSIT